MYNHSKTPVPETHEERIITEIWGGHRNKRLDGRDHKKRTKIAAEAWGGKGKQVCQALNFPK